MVDSAGAPERTKQLAYGLLPLVAAVFILGKGDANPWGIAALVVSGLLLLALLARRGRHTPWLAAAERLDAGGAVVLWKPGCTFCERLLLAMRNDERITWVNVWADTEANAEVRRLNNGNELTPTVLLGDDVLRNPSPDQLRARLLTHRYLSPELAPSTPTKGPQTRRHGSGADDDDQEVRAQQEQHDRRADGGQSRIDPQ